jgi:putative ABC transport system ATP-binding protein
MIKLENVSKEYYSGRGRIKVLDRVSLMVATGGMAVVAGKSGSGKTTLLNCIAGIEQPENGRVFCFGVDLLSISQKELGLFQRRKTGFIFQRGNLFSCLTVSENIAFPLVLNGLQKKKISKRVNELLEKIGLTGTGSALPHELSGGEAQRVAFARAIAHQPKMLLADEPTASLDSFTGRNLIELMTTIGKETGCTIIVATHDPEIVKYADQKIIIRDGRILTEQHETML